MLDVFLAASVPLPTRHRQFFESADVLLIREAVKALVEIALPVGRITFGGHPAITPLLALFVREGELPKDRVTIFQSAFFEAQFPAELTDFVDIRITEEVGNRDQSLAHMRRQMIGSRPFTAAVVIGGMEGIFDEIAMFRNAYPQAPVLPIASTGAAAAILHREGNFDSDLLTELTFPTLFRRRLLPLA